MTAVPAVPSLVIGTVSHARRTPMQRSFEHAHYQWLVDVDHLPRVPFLARFDARDHLDGGRRGGGIRGDLTRFLRGRGIDLEPDDRVLMLAHARSFGHVFDPLTVFWCLRPDGTERAVVFEVHNTYGERHAYLLDTDERGRGSVDKAFYVSPFNDTAGRYEVGLRLEADLVRVSVALDRDHRRVFTAVTTGTPEPATTRAVLRTFRRHLFMTHRVSALIRWHGIKLWLAKLPVQPRPPHSQEAVR